MCCESNIHIEEPETKNRQSYLYLTCSDCGAEVLSRNVFTYEAGEVEGPASIPVSIEQPCDAMMEVLVDITDDIFDRRL